MSEPIAQSMYSVPIVRTVGSKESKIPEAYQYRVARSSIPYVRCPLFPGENLVKVTWGGPETVLVNAFDTATKTGYQAGVIPADSGGGYPLQDVQYPRDQRPRLRVRHFPRYCNRSIDSNGSRHRHQHGRQLTPQGVA